MAPPPQRAPDEAWTIFGRWRRRSPGTRRLGVALLVLALLLTLIWARTPRPPLDDAATGATPSVASVTVAEPAAGHAPAQGA
jgi:ferric-dicitrate binding protein FerR (iron transport regulator)